MAVKLWALRANRPLPSGRFLVLISVWGWVRPQGHSAAGRIRSIEKSNDLIWIRTLWRVLSSKMWCREVRSMLRRQFLPPSSRSKISHTSIQQVASSILFVACKKKWYPFEHVLILYYIVTGRCHSTDADLVSTVTNTENYPITRNNKAKYCYRDNQPRIMRFGRVRVGDHYSVRSRLPEGRNFGGSAESRKRLRA
jgi:hypothetical protein